MKQTYGSDTQTATDPEERSNSSEAEPGKALQPLLGIFAKSAGGTLKNEYPPSKAFSMQEI
jgi:hypothetical protein